MSTATVSPADAELTRAVERWLFYEAELLDGGREAEWLATLVHRDISYRVPLRQTVERARGAGFHPRAAHADETYGSLTSRVARNRSDYAWAEDPPARIRHFVTNVRAGAGGPDRIEVHSNVLVFRLRMEQTQPHLFSAERHDVLVGPAPGWKLLSRTVYLDLTVIETHNLAIIF